MDGVAVDTIHSGAVTDLHIRVANRISRSTIDVEVEITGLTDVVIERYYGLQTKNNLWSEIDYGGSVSPLTQYSEGRTVREYSLGEGESVEWSGFYRFSREPL